MSVRHHNASVAYIGIEVLREGEEFGDDVITQPLALVLNDEGNGEKVAIGGSRAKLIALIRTAHQLLESASDHETNGAIDTAQHMLSPGRSPHRRH